MFCRYSKVSSVEFSEHRITWLRSACRNVSTKDISKIATELLAAADKYQLDLLKKLCEERLCSTLKVTNCVEYLVFGDMNQTFKLRSQALKLVAENVDSIIDTDVFKDLFKQKPELALEVMKAVNNK